MSLKITIPREIAKHGMTPKNEALTAFLCLNGFRKGGGTVVIETKQRIAKQLRTINKLSWISYKHVSGDSILSFTGEWK